ncbi:MAG: di-trans,poly-cis-decaprenylcistransferase [Ruminococcaceae bacterium]|nr:di-trans,poly-cis-decaprenylcistransferase [Oscillospiraceae bacterium]
MANIQVDERLRHIAFIMDGNGRWAKKRGMPREYGHSVGAKTFERVVRHCGDIGIRVVTVYAFSTENWRRPQHEVQAIMTIFAEFLGRAQKQAEEYNIHTVFLGDKSIFPPEIRARMEALERDTAHHPLTLNIAINYGGRDEIVHAVNTLIAQGKTEITEDDITANLYTAHCPPPDLIVRTGSEMRLSNFLLWQAAYAEFYFCDTLWPDMDDAAVDAAVEAFYARKRRFGGV